VVLAYLGVAATIWSTPIEQIPAWHRSGSVVPLDQCRSTAKPRAFGMTPTEDRLRIAGAVEIADLDHHLMKAAPRSWRSARTAYSTECRRTRCATGWVFRLSTPDSLPILGPVTEHPDLWLASGHGHFGMSGGLQSGRLLAQLITGKQPGIDPAPYGAQGFGRG
jgi:glycine/D-amino acid oxidase-like deaminating enzyme